MDVPYGAVTLKIDGTVIWCYFPYTTINPIQIERYETNEDARYALEALRRCREHCFRLYQFPGREKLRGLDVWTLRNVPDVPFLTYRPSGFRLLSQKQMVPQNQQWDVPYRAVAVWREGRRILTQDVYSTPVIRFMAEYSSTEVVGDALKRLWHSYVSGDGDFCFPEEKKIGKRWAETVKA